MINTLLAVLPIFVLIILGYGLRRFSIPSLEFWDLNNKLVYWVLIPALLFNKTSQIEVSADIVGKYAIVIYVAFFISIVLSLLIAKVMGWTVQSMTSVMQGAARHNTFIVLAVADTLFGQIGLSVAALASAIVIPMANIVIVTLMVWNLSQGKKMNTLFLETLNELIRNPLIISVLLGLLCNLLEWNSIPILHETTRLLGGAALPIVLMSVGASIKVRAESPRVYRRLFFLSHAALHDSV